MASCPSCGTWGIVAGVNGVGCVGRLGKGRARATRASSRRGRGDQPTQAHARGGAGRGGESARADEINAKIVWIRQGGGAGSRHVDHRVPVRKDKYRGCGEFREKSANCILHCGGELERGALFQEGRHRAYVVSHVRQELAVITKTAK